MRNLIVLAVGLGFAGVAMASPSIQITVNDVNYEGLDVSPSDIINMVLSAFIDRFCSCPILSSQV